MILSEEEVAKLFDEVHATPGYELTIDLEKQTVTSPSGDVYHFEIDQFRKYCLLNGLDDIGLTLQEADRIKAYEEKRLADKPWLARVAN